jgi:NAD(P)H-hydrate epimerase
LVIAGSSRYSGAAVLTAEAALRSGAGLVTLAIPQGINNAVIRIKPKEVITLPLEQNEDGSLNIRCFGEIRKFMADVIAIGPGLGRNKSTGALIRKVLTINKPLVVDADALNAIKLSLRLLRPNIVLTPHPGEMASLLGVSVKNIQADRKRIALKFTELHKATLVLKGYNTIVCAPGRKHYTNKTGNSGMSTAGSGDVLTGIIAAFLGQGLTPFDAAKYGAYLHGLAGDLAAEDVTEISLIASDIIAKIPQAIKCSS